MIEQNNHQQQSEEDQRDEETRLKQSEAVRYFCDRNMKVFAPYLNEEMGKLHEELKTEKDSKTKIVMKKMEFEDGRYVDYRDNLDEHSSFEFADKVIVFVTGVPGGVKYYSNIERAIGSNFCRLINFYTPGLDRKDERRGPYQGTSDQLVQLIEDFLNKLSIEKAIFIMHSYGGLIVKNFAYFKPHRVEALIQMASIPMTLWEGYKRYEVIESQKYDLDSKNLTFEQLQDEEFRQHLSGLINQTKDQLNSVPKEKLFNLGPIILFSFQDIVTMLKFKTSVPGKFAEIFTRQRFISKNIPRMMAYAPNDNLVLAPSIEEEMYEYVIGENSLKRQITNLTASQPQLDINDFNSNYIFKFDDATHNIQQEKGYELGILAKHFIRQLDSTQIITNQSKL